MSTAVCNSEGSEVNVRYARGRRGGHAGIPQGKATAVIPGNAARGSLLTWMAVELC